MDDDLERTTYHEAGHCVMAVRCGATIERATVDPEEDGFHGLVDIHWPRQAKFMDRLDVALSGPVAEMIYMQEPHHPGLVPEWAHDWKQAWCICRPSTESDLMCLKRLELIVAKLYKRLSSDAWWAAIAAVSDQLATHDAIEHEDVAYEVRNWIRD